MTHERVSVDFAADQVGVWTPETTASVTRKQIAAYAAATGEVDPRLLDGDAASIIFGVVPSWQAVAAVFKTVTAQEHWHRVVHGEHSIDSARALVPGDQITTRATVRSIRPVVSGTVVSVEALSMDAEGNLVIRQTSTGFYLGVHAASAVGESLHRPAPSPVLGAIEVRIGTDISLPRRYARASGDLSPIHLDDAAARAIGLPGVILHGMCTLALAGRAIVGVNGGGPTSLRSLACRFSGVAIPGDDLIVQVGDASFTAASPNGTTVLSSGSFHLGASSASLPEKVG